MSELREYVTSREAAEILGVSKARVDQLVKLKKDPLKFVMVGNIRLFKRSDVEAFKKRPRPTGRPKGYSPGPKRDRKDSAS